MFHSLSLVKDDNSGQNAERDYNTTSLSEPVRHVTDGTERETSGYVED